eukprot:4752262-Pyramimonas_sp.AAC.1
MLLRLIPKGFFNVGESEGNPFAANANGLPVWWNAGGFLVWHNTTGFVLWWNNQGFFAVEAQQDSFCGTVGKDP